MHEILLGKKLLEEALREGGNKINKRAARNVIIDAVQCAFLLEMIITW